MLCIDRCWTWSNRLIFISEKDHPGVSRKRNWTGEDGGREPRQKAGAEIQGSSSVDMEERCFARHLGNRAGRNSWAMEWVREAGGTLWILPQPAVRAAMPFTVRVQVGGSLKKPGNASRGRQGWSGD